MKPLSRTHEGGFLDHLEVLRRRILVVAAVFLVASVVAFLLIDRIFGLLVLPFRTDPPSFVAIKPQEKFITYLQLAAFCGALIAVPVLIAQLAGFIRPALTKEERRPFHLSHAFAHLLFLAGVAFSLFVIAPFAVRFFLSFAADDGVTPMWSIAEYARLLRGIVVGITLVFQTPLVMVFLTSVDIVSIDTFRRLRRHALVVAFLVGAFLTPPDVLTQILVGVTLYLLFELSLVLARLLGAGRRATTDSNPVETP